MTYYNNIVLTDTGFKSTKNLTPKDFTFNRLGKHTRIVYTSSSKTSPTGFSKVTTEVDDVPLLLRNDRKVYSVDLTSFEKTYIQVEDLTESHWVFSPWVSKEELSPKLNVDLSKYVDNQYDVSYIYLFNNEILDIADTLKIPFHAVKELLIREAAEYEEHLNKLKLYIYDKYNILETPSEEETSFSKFKQYVLQNHVFKMSRYLQIDLPFLGFVACSLTRALVTQDTFNKNNRYQLTYSFSREDTVLKNYLLEFLKATNVKFEVTDNIVRVFNKPLFKFVTEGLFKDISFIFNIPPILFDSFLEMLFINKDILKLPLPVLLQIKQAFLYKKTVLSIKDNPSVPNAYSATLLKKDSLETLEDVIIYEEDGYYSKVSEIHKATTKEDYIFTNSEDQEVLYLNCLIKGI